MIFRFLRKKAPLTYEKLILAKGGVTQRQNLANVTTYENYKLALAVAVVAEIRLGGPLGEVRGDERKQLLAECEAIILTPGFRDAAQYPHWYPEFKVNYINAQRMYWDQLQDLKEGNQFLWDVVEPRTNRQIRMHLSHLILPAIKQMTAPKKRRWIGPTGLGSAYFACRGCAFKAPCQAVMAGADHRSIITDQYKEREVFHV